MSDTRLPAVLAKHFTDAALADATESAVLVPILLHHGEPRLLLTRRADALRNHSGQVSFPGGRRDPDDLNLQATALREAHEEVGLLPDSVELLGYLDDVLTFSGFRITPIVGIVTPPFEPKFDTGEVAEVFELPLQTLMADDAFEQKTFHRDSQALPYWELRYAPQRIWGATAAILFNLKHRLDTVL